MVNGLIFTDVFNDRRYLTVDGYTGVCPFFEFLIIEAALVQHTPLSQANCVFAILFAVCCQFLDSQMQCALAQASSLNGRHSLNCCGVRVAHNRTFSC
jgi:hypothetical protein